MAGAPTEFKLFPTRSTISPNPAHPYRQQHERQAAYSEHCAQCHGPQGAAVEDVDLIDPELLRQFSRSVQLQVLLQEELPDGSPHVETMPSSQQLADILEYLR